MAHYENTGRYFYLTWDILNQDIALEDLEDVEQIEDPNLILPDGVTTEEVRTELAPFLLAYSQAEEATNAAGGFLYDSGRENLVPSTIAAMGPVSFPAQSQQLHSSPRAPAAQYGVVPTLTPFMVGHFQPGTNRAGGLLYNSRAGSLIPSTTAAMGPISFPAQHQPLHSSPQAPAAQYRVVPTLTPSMLENFQLLTNGAGGLLYNSRAGSLNPSTTAPMGPMSFPAQPQQLHSAPQTPVAHWSPSQSEHSPYPDSGYISEASQSSPGYASAVSEVTPTSIRTIESEMDAIWNEILHENGGIDEPPGVLEMNNAHAEHQEGQGVSGSNDETAELNLEDIHNWPFGQEDVDGELATGVYGEEVSEH
jgi:hypothetical protein